MEKPQTLKNRSALPACRRKSGGLMKVIDPVCKMTIDSEKAAATSEYKGQTIYFCAKGCKAKFDQAPEKYVGK
jgi:YHS domain-containing protein